MIAFSVGTLDDFRAAFETNVARLLLLSQALLPVIRRGGRIINVSLVAK